MVGLGFYHYGVFTVIPEGEVEKVVNVPQQPAGLGLLLDASLLIVSMVDCRVMRRFPDGRMETYADLSDLATSHVNTWW